MDYLHGKAIFGFLYASIYPTTSCKLHTDITGLIEQTEASLEALKQCLWETSSAGQIQLDGETVLFVSGRGVFDERQQVEEIKPRAESWDTIRNDIQEWEVAVGKLLRWRVIVCLVLRK